MPSSTRRSPKLFVTASSRTIGPATGAGEASSTLGCACATSCPPTPSASNCDREVRASAVGRARLRSTAVKAVLLLVAAAMLAGASPATPQPQFVGTVSKVTAAELKYSYRPGCPVGPSELSRPEVSHWDFAGRRRVGLIVV